jgi:hypothetical protein
MKASVTGFISGLTFSIGIKNEPLNIRFPPNMYTALFGEGFFQSSSIVRINKSDLPGLTPTANNTAESLLVALIARNLLSGNKVLYLKIGVEFWGYGYSNGKRIDTLLIHLFNYLAVASSYEVADYDNSVNPMNY